MGLQVSLVKIPVSNVAEAVRFYTEVLGLTESFVAAEYGWAQLQSDNMPLALYEPSKGGGQGVAGGCDSVHFVVDELTPLTERLIAAGITLEDVQQRGNDGTTFLELADPDGNIIKIFYA